MSYRCNFGNGQYRTRHIAGMINDHEASIEVYCRGNIVYVEAAIGGTGNNSENKSPLFQPSQGSHYGIMLHRAGDNAVAGLKQTFQDYIYSVSRVAGEDDSRGGTAIKEAGNVFPGIVHHPRRLNR